MAITALIFTSCSPVDRVKWSKINLLGNDIPVKRIINGLSGSSGIIEWSEKKQIITGDCHVVSVKITRKNLQFLLSFSYDRKNGECRLIEYRVNGEPESPFYIYKFMNANRYRFLPAFIDDYF